MTLPKCLWTLISVEVVCIGLGLWVQQRYIVAELRAASAHAAPAAAETATVVPGALGIGLVTFAWTAGLAVAATYLIFSRMTEEGTRRRVAPDRDALRRSLDLLRTRDAVIFGLAKLADSRDAGTGDHLERICLYSSALAAALRQKDAYRDLITPAFVKNIEISAALHDIGKVGIEDAVLLKPGPLSPEERRRMQAHTEIGDACLREIERRLGASNFLCMAREIAVSHHEWWNGQGYPKGLAGTEIPLAARIVAIADVYDALSTNRIYKDAMPHAECVAFIRGEAGRHFDPHLVETFVTIESTFRTIAAEFRSHGPARAERLLEEVDRNLQFESSPSALVPKDAAEPTPTHLTATREV